ncbi:MAG: mevalonate kinase [Thermoplasmatota archaeon]
MATGVGYGKVILFGEHFVVYGQPAIASAISDTTVAEVTLARGAGGLEAGPETYVIEGDGWILHDNRPETPGYKKGKAEEQRKSVELILAHLKIDPRKSPINIELRGGLRAASGVGASAAACAALARALSSLFGLGLTDEEINAAAHEGERGFHDTPSGIDDTAATYGGLFIFRRSAPKNQVELLKVPAPMELVLGNTGLTASTRAVVGEVRRRREEEPERYGRVFKEAERVALDARAAIEAGDLARVGALMSRNHELLKELGVSCEELDRLVEIALREGAAGAKLTGTGRGGLMVALTPGRELQERVARAIENAGFTALRTSVGG